MINIFARRSRLPASVVWRPSPPSAGWQRKNYPNRLSLSCDFGRGLLAAPFFRAIVDDNQNFAARFHNIFFIKFYQLTRLPAIMALNLEILKLMGNHSWC
jgi:hypothetical protein